MQIKWVLMGLKDMRIEKRITPYNFTNGKSTDRIKFIVIHYFGSLSTAANVANFFRNAYRGASVHYILDGSDVLYQSVEDKDVAWHCGTSGKYYHQTCRNSNSIGIEVQPFKRNTASLLATDTDWYFTDAAVSNLVQLTKQLMAKYNVPLDCVLRHYDVTHKICPNPFVVRPNEWAEFKTKLKLPTNYIVRVTDGALNIRSGPGTQHGIVGVIRDKGVYTIVDTNGSWGKLKSGLGWIHLGYTTRL